MKPENLKKTSGVNLNSKKHMYKSSKSKVYVKDRELRVV